MSMHGRHSARFTSLLLAGLAALLGVSVVPAHALVPGGPPTASAVGGVSPATSDDAASRPNILLITTDDMAATDLQWMPKTRRLLESAGVRSTSFLSNHPLCCPARAEILTGTYAQNNGVYSNGGTFGGYQALRNPGKNIGAWLQASGYRTALVGKHLNGWTSRAKRQPGWTIFNPSLKRVYAPYGVTMYNNGKPRKYRKVHSTDLMGKLTTDYIRRFARAGDPFFIWTSQAAPHSTFRKGAWRPPISPPRHRAKYRQVSAPSISDPAFNEADVSDKPGYVQSTTPRSPASTTTWHRARIRSLLAVDDQVQRAVAALREVGELSNTYIFFTSDNGFMLGEHRQWSKNRPYDEAIDVPLLVRGPGLPAGAVRGDLFSLVDLAPTFLEIAGGRASTTLDGRSMLASLRGEGGGYPYYLIQAGLHEQRWWWRGIRSPEFTYVRYRSGFEELYDRAKDPHQLVNVAADSAYAGVREDYAARLAQLADCAGKVCRPGPS